jgi:hypothetical protein
MPTRSVTTAKDPEGPDRRGRRGSRGWAAALAIGVLLMAPPALSQSLPLGGSPAVQSLYYYEFPTEDTTALLLNISYDTNHYSDAWEWYLPPFFSPTAVVDDHGNALAYTTRQDGQSVLVSLHTGYPPATGVRTFTIRASAPTTHPLASGLALVQLDAIPAGNATQDGSKAYLLARAPAGGALLDTHGNAWSAVSANGSAELRRSLVVMFPQAISEYTVKAYGPYAILRPLAWNADIRAREVTVLNDTVALLPQLSTITGMGPLANRSFLLIYGPDNLFTWEAGYETDGVIALHASALEGPEPNWEIAETRTLLHETTHAVLRQVLGGNGDLLPSWFNEGTARYMEGTVDTAHPALASGCSLSGAAETCFDFRIRPPLNEVEAFYNGNATFSLSWDPAKDSNDTVRGWEYDYAGYMIGAYVQEHGPSALAAVVRDLNATTLDDPSASEVANAVWHAFETVGGVPDEDAIVHPYSAEYNQSPKHFATLVAPLVRGPAPELPPFENPLSPGAPIGNPFEGVSGASAVVSPTVLFGAGVAAVVLLVLLLFVRGSRRRR